MKKICFITTVSSTLKNFLLDTATYLHQSGMYDITFICDTDHNFKDTLPDYIHYIPVPMKRGVSISSFLSIIEIIRVLKSENFDMVQYSTPNASLYAAIASFLCKVPIRLYCQWGILYVGFSGLKRTFFKFIERIVCLLSTIIQPDSNSNLTFSVGEGLYTDKKSCVIWNGSASGVNLLKFNINNKNIWRSEIRNKFDISSDDFVIGFVGRINKDKGFNELLEAFQKLQQDNDRLKLMIVGKEEKIYEINPELYSWSKSCPNLYYCGETLEVEKYMSAFDIFVLPSYREGFGSVIIEAEAMGIPVAVSNIPGPIDAIIAGKTGIIFESKNTNTLYNAILFLIDNTTVLSEMSDNAIEFSRNNFDSKKLLEFILEDRNNLLGIKNIDLVGSI